MKPEIKRRIAIDKLNDIFFASFYSIPLLKEHYPVEVYYLDLINRYIPRIPIANHIDINIFTENYIYRLIDKKKVYVKSLIGSDFPQIENTMNNQCLIFKHEIRHLFENGNFNGIVEEAISDYNYWILALASWTGFCKYIVQSDETANILSTVSFIKEEFAQIGFSWIDADDINYVSLPYSLFKR